MNDNENIRMDSEQIPVGESAPQEVNVPAEEPVEPAAPKKRTPAKKLAVIAAAAVIALAVLVGVIAASVSSPLALVGKGIANSAKAMEKNAVVQLFADTTDDGSVELLCGLEDITTYLVGFGIDGSASVKLYSSETEGAISGNLEMGGETLLDLLMVFNEKEMALTSDVLLGMEAYGVGLENLAEKYENSEFGPDGHYSLGIEPAELQQILDNAEGSRKMAKDAEPLMEAAGEKLMSIVSDHAEITKRSDVLTFNKAEAKVTAVEIAADSEALASISVELIEYFRDNEEIRAFAYEHAENLLSLTGEYPYYSDAEEFVDEIYENLDAMTGAKLEEVAASIVDSGAELAVTCYVTKSGKELVGVDVEVEGYDTVSVSVLVGPTFENPQMVTFRFDDGYDDFCAICTADVSDKGKYSAGLNVSWDGETVLSGEFNWDKESGAFEMEVVEEGEEQYRAKGTMNVSEKQTVIAVESVGDSYDEYALDVSLILSASDTVPDMPAYTDLLEMDVAEIEDLFYDLLDAAGSLELGNLLYLFW